MADLLAIEYAFAFENGETKRFVVRLDKDTLNLIGREHPAPPDWAAIGVQRCGNCTLDSTTRYCPIALNMTDIVNEFRDIVSYEKVFVTVVTGERTYSKDTTVQEGLSPLIGIVMVTSGCPVMDRLKPMVRFHLPFATIEETVYRMASMYLVAQYYRNKAGKAVDWSLQGLHRIYAEVGEVNRGFADRLREAAKHDANINALLNLHCFAEMVPALADGMLKGLQRYFSSYLDD